MYTEQWPYTHVLAQAINPEKKVIELARKKLIDIVLVSELSRWGPSTSDLRTTTVRTVRQRSSTACTQRSRPGYLDECQLLEFTLSLDGNLKM